MSTAVITLECHAALDPASKFVDVCLNGLIWSWLLLSLGMPAQMGVAERFISFKLTK